MHATTPPIVLTPALEDYLETIYELVQSRKVARVKDIAAARDVKAGSVSPAMRRLADLGLIRYHQREYIDLTEEGEIAARRVMSRHRVLRRFFFEVLRMEENAADREACAIEHSLSNDAMDRLVRLFEFVQSCPEGRVNFIDRFHACPIIDSSQPDCGHRCQRGSGDGADIPPSKSLFELAPGRPARVLRVEAEGAVRQRLLDMGLIPGASIEIERTAPGGDPVWVRLLGSQLALRRKEAEAIQVRED
ncbi:MAG: DtxR family transcriptional regulator [Pseudomonadota bacterium]